MSDNNKIRPLIILPKGQVSKKDIQRLNDNGLCVIEAEDPSLIRFAEPPPSMDYDIRERAALSLFRRVMVRGNHMYSRADLTQIFVDALLHGSALEPVSDVKFIPANQPKKVSAQ